MSDVDEATIRDALEYTTRLGVCLPEEPRLEGLAALARLVERLADADQVAEAAMDAHEKACAELVRLGERARQADKTILGLQHARRLDQHKTFDAVAKACGYTGKDWDAMLADVAELRAALAAAEAERDEAKEKVAWTMEHRSEVVMLERDRANKAEARLAAAETALREIAEP